MWPAPLFLALTCSGGAQYARLELPGCGPTRDPPQPIRAEPCSCRYLQLLSEPVTVGLERLNADTFPKVMDRSMSSLAILKYFIPI
eukprot:scaffold42215_cov60-Phaeocystis_antarctica.AAC.4